MADEQKSGLDIHPIESGLIGLLVFLACLRAALADSGAFLSLMHGATIAVAYILVRGALSAANIWLGRIVFGAFTVLLLFEIVIQFLTGLHVNMFVLSLLAQNNSSLQIGVSMPGLLLMATLVFVAAVGISARYSSMTRHLSPLKAVAIFLVLFGTTQLTYASAYFAGSAKVLQVRRTLPFFWAPHPYQSNKLLGIVLGPRDKNPFALSDRVSPETTPDMPPLSAGQFNDIDLETAPNILLIVADSLRSKDLQENLDLAPSLKRASADGFFSLNHYSVSNCTHFSMYTLLTGELAASYGTARRASGPVGLYPTLLQLGYRISTAESSSLDWYDLSDIILPAETKRWVAEGEDALENDSAVTAQTVTEIQTWPAHNQPTMHLAFYQGTHYPYSDTLNVPGRTNEERYVEAIREFDSNLGTLLDTARTLPITRETIIIVTSDHGEEFLSEGRVGHASRLTDEQVQVPFLLIGAEPAPEAIRSHTDVSDFILQSIGALNAEPERDRPVILANCDYDFPNGFALLQEGERFDFYYDQGYLVPAADHSPLSDQQSTLEAAKQLLRMIGKRP